MHDLTNMFRTIALAGAVLFTASSYAKPNEQPGFTGNDMLKACTEMDPTSEPMKRLPNAEEARDHRALLRNGLRTKRTWRSGNEKFAHGNL